MSRLFLAFVACLLAVGTPPAKAAPRLDLNAASQQQLAALDGVGEELASRIVAYRGRHGPFDSVDDLGDVPGVSPELLARLGAHLRAEGPAPLAPPLPCAPDGSTVAARAVALLAGYRDEPDVRAVQEAAARYAEVHPDLLASWRHRARYAGLAPRLSVEDRYVDLSRQRLRTGGGSPDYELDEVGTEQEPAVRAEWDLSRLVFNPDELRVAGETVDLVRLRQRVLDEVTRLYFERRRREVERDLAPPADVAGRVRQQLRIDELTASLDALTGGFFSQRLGAAPDGGGRS